MTLKEIIAGGINPALALLPAKMDTASARIMLLAIGLQESRFLHRRQVGGPARGFWQFEQSGGVRGVLTHSASRDFANAVCAARGVEPVTAAVYPALETDDVLAAAFARLLLWTDAGRLPSAGDAQGAWILYTRTWRPGKPHPQTWSAVYVQAVAEVNP
ncbi:hypothetical protein RAS12_11825 [Achromobacter seleniivolatilans]|uniref:Uncharacterized protein n=1 Tax=Achromobacter seleniivolatilans TaxID=3047478 RepID=A0ABY9M8K3_9BURK|nr:hypothetical protein [Achromobacter sp. R39]WMD23025.1 hypothetical protein RAS12_11825 [Achromobacter sp. R39]